MPIPQVPSPLAQIIATYTYDADWFPGDTYEQQIQNAINNAAADGALRVLVKRAFNSALITFNTAIQISKEDTGRISADNGDTDKTFDPDDYLADIQRFATALTANRTITLGTGFRGAYFRVVRTGLGAFTLDVGGLKTIPSATAAFVEVAHDGTAWRLVGYGAL